MALAICTNVGKMTGYLVIGASRAVLQKTLATGDNLGEITTKLGTLGMLMHCFGAATALTLIHPLGFWVRRQPAPPPPTFQVVSSWLGFPCATSALVTGSSGTTDWGRGSWGRSVRARLPGSMRRCGRRSASSCQPSPSFPSGAWSSAGPSRGGGGSSSGVCPRRRRRRRRRRRHRGCARAQNSFTMSLQPGGASCTAWRRAPACGGRWRSRTQVLPLTDRICHSCSPCFG
jgi:hypothetical protein